MSESAGLKMMDAMYVQRKKLETVFYYFDTNGDGVSVSDSSFIVVNYILN